MLGGYFAVRPVRETIGTILGAERVTDLFVVTWIASLAVVPLYGWACTRFRRTVFLPWVYGGVALSLLVLGVMLAANEENIWADEFFYVWISILNLFIVSVFWSFLLELFNSDQTRRLFGVIAAGGTTGALLGPLFTDISVTYIGNSGVLFMGAGFFIAAIFCQRKLLSVWAGLASDPAARATPDRPMGVIPLRVLAWC